MYRDQEERFGMPESAFAAAFEANGLDRDGMYVPTRTEVATVEPRMLRLWLSGWIFESTAELIPSDEMVRAVLKVLKGRPYVSELEDLIREIESFFDDGP